MRVDAVHANCFRRPDNGFGLTQYIDMLAYLVPNIYLLATRCEWFSVMIRECSPPQSSTTADFVGNAKRPGLCMQPARTAC